MNNLGKNSQNQVIKNKIKSYIPKDWWCEMRIIQRIIIETLKGIKRTGLVVNLIIITTIASILLIFGALFKTTLSVSTFIKELGNSLEVSVYLKDSSNPKQVAKEIKEMKNVQRVKIITKEESWNNFKKEIDVSDINNPLPNTLHVKANKPADIEPILNTIKKMDTVESVNYAEKFAKKMEILSKVVHTSTIFVVIIVAVLTITIINNTIQLVIQSKKEEIEIMRLMGVSNWYIKLPFVLQGAIYGFLGAFLSLLPLDVVQNMLNNVHSFFMISAPVNSVNIVGLAIFFLGIMFGALGSLLSIKKHLQV